MIKFDKEGICLIQGDCLEVMKTIQFNLTNIHTGCNIVSKEGL